MARILIIDDDKEDLFLWRMTLERAEHEVFALAGGGKALERIAARQPDLVITDIMMPGLTGGTIYEMIRSEIGPDLPVILCTGSSLKPRPTEDPLMQFCLKTDGAETLLEATERLLALAKS